MTVPLSTLAAAVERDPLRAAVENLLVDVTPSGTVAPRRWPRKNAQLPALVSDSSVEVVELSYGGLRLEGPVPPAGVGTPVTVTFPTLGVSVTAVARWTKPTQTDAVSLCGAEIADPGGDATALWRGVVDSVH
jgi:hypothetical protein